MMFYYDNQLEKEEVYHGVLLWRYSWRKLKCTVIFNYGNQLERTEVYYEVSCRELKNVGDQP